jgi:outer membrane protein assembly factor BamC
MLRPLTVLICIAISSSGCSWSRNSDSSIIDYQRARTANPLEVPPDLTYKTDEELYIPNPNEAATYSGYQQQLPTVQNSMQAILPQNPKVTMQRDGQSRWLVVEAAIEPVWDKVYQFCLNNGLELERIEPQIGIMETGWLENRADIPQDLLRNLLGSLGDVIYSAPTRDKFRIRLERAPNQEHTEIYLTHSGMQEVATNNDQFAWQPRASNPELEIELLNRLILALGAKISPEITEASSTSNTVRASLAEERELTVYLPLEQVWRLTGLILDRLGIVVEDREPEQGLYYIRYNDPEFRDKQPGFWGRLFGRKQSINEHYIIQLKSSGADTNITVLNQEELPEYNRNTRNILNILYEEFK